MPQFILKDLQDAARIMGVQLHVANVSNECDIDVAFPALVQKQVGALIIPGFAFLLSHRRQIIALAARHAIPTVYSERENVVDGGLISYGPSQADAYWAAGIYVSKILKGTKPADLPVDQLAKFEVTVNLQTAKAIGIEMPLSLLMRVSEAIE